MIPSKVEASLTLALLGRVRDMRAQGIEVASFAAGEPDFNTPDVVVNAAIASMKAGNTKYVATPGIDQLREAVAKDYRDRLGAPWVQKENVLICAGGKQGIFLTFMGLLESGDEVIVPAPYWVSYPHIVHATKGKMVVLACNKENDFFPTPEELEKVWNPKTKALIFSSPGNPSGCMIQRAALKSLVDWCVKKKVTLVFDELYERLELSDLKHVCPLSLVGAKESEYIVAVNACSKSMAMTGWRLGYLLSAKENISALSSLHGQMITSLPGFIQVGAAEGLKHADEFLAPVIESYKKRLSIITRGLDEISSVKYLKPTGSFYICVDVRDVMKNKKILTDSQLAEDLLNKERVVVVPGESMGMPGWLRFSFATSEEEIKKGLIAFKRYCDY